MPYGLNVTVPAMVLEHALGFGILEAVITALIFIYIQKTDASLLYGEKAKAMDKKGKRATSA
jgi:cobalt/nickel transport system permease protein